MSEQAPPPAQEPQWSEGLRERKKRITRRLITDTATAMFLERGFDDVKVTDVAEACGLSEKTVYNYFPTKESLLLDREAEVAAAIWRTLGTDPQGRSPVEGTLVLLAAQLDELYETWLTDGMSLFRRFAELIDATPSLRAAERDMSDRLVRTAAEALAQHAGVSPEAPEPQIAATALVGLWRIQYDAIRRCSIEDLSPQATRDVVTGEVRRAARLIESGLWAFTAMTDERATRQQFKTAAETAQMAGRQVASAIRQARAAWQQAQREADRGEGGAPSAMQGLAALIDQTEKWKRDQAEHQDQWKQAYRARQATLRQAQRELQNRFRQANQASREAPGGGQRGRRPEV